MGDEKVKQELCSSLEIYFYSKKDLHVGELFLILSGKKCVCLTVLSGGRYLHLMWETNRKLPVSLYSNMKTQISYKVYCSWIPWALWTVLFTWGTSRLHRSTQQVWWSACGLIHCRILRVYFSGSFFATLVRSYCPMFLVQWATSPFSWVTQAVQETHFIVAEHVTAIRQASIEASRRHGYQGADTACCDRYSMLCLAHIMIEQVHFLILNYELHTRGENWKELAKYYPDDMNLPQVFSHASELALVPGMDRLRPPAWWLIEIDQDALPVSMS